MKAKIEGIHFLDGKSCIVRVSYDATSLHLSVGDIDNLEEEVKTKLRAQLEIRRVQAKVGSEWVGKEIEV